MADAATGKSAMGKSWSPLLRDSLPDIIAKKVLESIASHELAAGERLPSERELANQFRVGRPTVREALRSLEAQGFLSIQQGRGTFVAERPEGGEPTVFDYRGTYELRDLFAMRRVLEVPAAAWAALRNDEATLKAAEAILAELDEEGSKETIDWKEVQRLDSEFHLKIVEAAGNGFLSRTQGILQHMLLEGMQSTLQAPGRLEKSRADHQLILDAIRRGDARTAELAADAHITAARDVAFQRAKSSSGEPVLPPEEDLLPYTFVGRSSSDSIDPFTDD